MKPVSLISLLDTTICLTTDETQDEAMLALVQGLQRQDDMTGTSYIPFCARPWSK